MRGPCLLPLLLLIGSGPLLAQDPAPRAAAQPAARDAGALPVRRVVLYKTGVGYFEHLGRVRDRQDVVIRFTSAQLNDALKSLTAIDLGSGRITGISYNSMAPTDQRLGALRLPVGASATTVDLLAALRGARIEVTTGATVAVGRLLSVERHTRPKGQETVTVMMLSLVTAGGEVRSFELTPSVAVRIADGELRQEVSRYLDVVGSTRERDVRQMVISTAGSGDRQLFVSYISEVPIWKTTYRLVLRDKGASPLLQGWAIVDNTIGEDWTGVSLSLVAGAPQSFIQNISQPYYGRRPTVPLPQAALLTPQTHQPSIQAPAAAPVAETVTAARNQPPDLNAVRAGGAIGGVAAGSAGGIVGGVVGGPPAAPAPPEPPGLGAQMSRQIPAAAGAPAGDLFEYRIGEPVTLRKNQSALVPIVNAEIAAEKVAIWNRAPGSGRPLRAVWITNGSGLTLDGGSITVIDGDAFAGEGLIEPLKPGERRLVSYAADLGMLVDARVETPPGRIVRARARDGIVLQETAERATWTYTVRSEEDRPVTLVIEHPQRQGWKLAAGRTADESTPTLHRFRLVVEPRKTATLVVPEVRGFETRIAIGEFGDSHFVQLATNGGASASLQQALAPIFARRSELSALERQLASLEAQRNTIMQDQERLRENMRALRGSREEKQLLQRYTRQLDEQETRLEQLRARIADTTRQRDKARDALNELVAGFTFEDS